ncbi:DUF937 domain-containing protein [Streptomyces sp. NPDC051016]|uniref:DUF937 domain-containing protein n=1 Tax=Streptomyces sp. NPDC051016 TaxID=3365638 RepID=UPI0037BBF24B
MTESSFQDDVLDGLGDRDLNEIAGLLGTDTDGAREAVAETAGTMSSHLRQKAVADDDDAAEVREALSEVAEPPLQGVATLGGGLAGGLMAGLLTKMSRPIAQAVSKKTGIPAANVDRIIRVLIPVVMAVFAKRAAATKGAAPEAAPGAAPSSGAAPGAGSGGLGELLEQILGGGKQ